MASFIEGGINLRLVKPHRNECPDVEAVDRVFNVEHIKHFKTSVNGTRHAAGDVFNSIEEDKNISWPQNVTNYTL